MPVSLFANKSKNCPYGHSLAPGMLQKVSWLPCICTPAREAAEHGDRGMGHITLWCGACSAEDHRDTVFYEPPHELGHDDLPRGWMTRPDALSASETTARATATAADRSCASTVTMLIVFSARCALMTLAALLDAACAARLAYSPGWGRWPPSLG